MQLKDLNHFQDLLLSFSKETEVEERKKLEAIIWQEYGTENTVLVLDMSGFSLLTRKYGIVHYLSMVRRMQLTTEPIIKSHGGTIIKFEADNCFAVLPDPLAATRAAITLQLAFNAANLLTDEELDIHIAIGIDYGKVLIIDNMDCFGDTVNRASKMGEDIGNAGEILISKEAMELIPADAEIKGHPVELNISGLSFSAFSIEYKPPAPNQKP
ncbi:MAG: adenylate/guanylate cyclase domain-containing protein [Anaerolineales bacterium]